MGFIKKLKERISCREIVGIVESIDVIGDSESFTTYIDMKLGLRLCNRFRRVYLYGDYSKKVKEGSYINAIILRFCAPMEKEGSAGELELYYKALEVRAL